MPSAGRDSTSGRLEVLLEADGGGYRASWEAGTAGLVGTLFPFSSQGSAEGRRDGERYLPSRYDGRSEWRDGGSQWRVAFAADGRATQIEVPADDLAGREPVPEALRVGPDPASLALAAIARAAPGIRLDGQSFDGRRAVRVELACADGGRRRRNSPARYRAACSPVPRAPGASARRARPSGSRGASGCAPACTATGFWPVRLEAPSRFGTVAARLVSIDRVPAAG